jgi:hypothetical protein
MITTATYVHTGVHTGPTLAKNDATRSNRLTAKYLYAEAFGFGIAAVLGAAACFLVCHAGTSLNRR